MQADARPFSHAAEVTDYMRIVARRVLAGPAERRILDIPAGSGKLAEMLRAGGQDVVCADINREHPHYVYADMEHALPFSDGEFDVAICLEGVEHLIDPVQLIREITRVTRSGGEIIVSLPNVANFYSRLQFLLTGTFYQFNPAEVPSVGPGEMRDRGHITPLTYFQLRYLFGHFGARVKDVLGDRWKKWTLAPLWLLLAPAAWLWSRALFLRAAPPEQAQRNREMLSDSWRFAALFSRSLIVVFERQAS